MDISHFFFPVSEHFLCLILLFVLLSFRVTAEFQSLLLLFSLGVLRLVMESSNALGWREFGLSHPMDRDSSHCARVKNLAGTLQDPAGNSAQPAIPAQYSI